MKKLTPKQLASLLGLSLSLGWPGASLAQVPQTPVFVPTPPDQGAPTGRQRGGGSRGDCPAYQGLTALVPEVDGTVWSQTASATPHFFFYVPHALDSAVPIEFVIQDGNDSYAFRQTFTVESTAGILNVPVTLETNGKGLEADQTYTWALSIYCDAARPSAAVSVSGTVQRVADSEGVNQIAEPSPTAQSELIGQYAAAGIWHEAIELAIALHQTEPNNPEYLETLATLLQQSGLADINPTAPVFSDGDG